MTAPMVSCDDLAAFVDGELDALKAEAFRTHMTTCAACRRALPDAVVLAIRLNGLKPQKDSP